MKDRGVVSKEVWKDVERLRKDLKEKALRVLKSPEGDLNRKYLYQPR